MRWIWKFSEWIWYSEKNYYGFQFLAMENRFLMTELCKHFLPWKMKFNLFKWTYLYLLGSNRLFLNRSNSMVFIRDRKITVIFNWSTRTQNRTVVFLHQNHSFSWNRFFSLKFFFFKIFFAWFFFGLIFFFNFFPIIFSL